MSEYLFRQAEKKDISFLADVVIAAEKGNSNNLSYSTLFNLTEEKVREFIVLMFEEEIEGCEFSLSNYIVAEQNGKLVGGFGAWIECYNGCLPSKILKSNLIHHFFGKKSIEFLKERSHIIKDVLSEREKMTLQFEHLFVSDNHRGHNIAGILIHKLEERALFNYPTLKKIQFQLFKNNDHVIKLFEKHGYRVVRYLRSDHPEIKKYLPFNEKYIMEKEL